MFCHKNAWYTTEITKKLDCNSGVVMAYYVVDDLSRTLSAAIHATRQGCIKTSQPPNTTPSRALNLQRTVSVIRCGFLFRYTCVIGSRYDKLYLIVILCV